MRSRLFRLNQIKPPGRVNLPVLGTVNLTDLPDATLTDLYKAGCPFLQPTAEGMLLLYPDVEPITTRHLELDSKGSRKKKRKT